MWRENMRIYAPRGGWRLLLLPHARNCRSRVPNIPIQSKAGVSSQATQTREFVNVRFLNIPRRSNYSNIFWSEGPSGSNLCFRGDFLFSAVFHRWKKLPFSAMGRPLKTIFLKSLREGSDLEPDLDPNLGPREANEKSPIKIDQWGSRIRVLSFEPNYGLMS